MALEKRTVDINTTRGLALALPISRGHRIVVLGEDLGPLVVSLQRTGVVVTLVADRPQAKVEDQRSLGSVHRLPVHDRAADHAIVVATTSVHLDALVDLARVLSPRGHLLTVVPHATTVRRRADPASTSPRALRRRIADAGFVPTETYGVRQRITDVRHLVPLSGPALRWYVRSAYLPTSRLGAVVPVAASVPGGERVLGRYLFPALAVAACREGS